MPHFQLVSCALAFLLATSAFPPVRQQMADPNFDASVRNPAYTSSHPKVLFDEAHNNFHTASGRYKPFADLLTNDGYRITPNKAAFTKETLVGYDVLIVANAMYPPHGLGPAETRSPFTAEECDAVRDWVNGGGSLLLIADHAPFGNAAKPLAAAFGVDMSAGMTEDSVNYDHESQNETMLLFSRENKLLGDHSITLGRNQSERINKVVTFTGQSLKGPEGSTAILKLGHTAKDVPPVTAEQWKQALEEAKRKAAKESKTAGEGASTTRGLAVSLPVREGISAAGRAQGLAFAFGKGRVVVLGEAGLLSAQVIKGDAAEGNGSGEIKFGMNYPGTDDRQFGLNIMHWLSRLLN